MKAARTSFFGLLVLLSSIGVEATPRVTTARLQSQLFVGTGPSSTSCTLKGFHLGLVTFDTPKTIMFGEPHASRIEMMGAFVETTSPECLKEYAVVQWIRGCIYSSTYRKNTDSVGYHFGYRRNHRGVSVPFVHPDWVIDSMKADPLYYGAPAQHTEDLSRLDYYRVPKASLEWKSTPKTLKMIENLVNRQEGYTLYRDQPKRVEQKLATPTAVYYVKDSPTHASWGTNPYDTNQESATNASLEFKVCIYRTQDVPLTGDPERFDVASKNKGPIHCFDWAAKNRWNFRTQTMESFTEMAPQCNTLHP